MALSEPGILSRDGDEYTSDGCSKLWLLGQDVESPLSRLKVKLASSGGVGFCARGYSFESRDDRGFESLIKKGGYDLLVVVVVVTVLVSMHSATSNFILERDR